MAISNCEDGLGDYVHFLVLVINALQQGYYKIENLFWRKSPDLCNAMSSHCHPSNRRNPKVAIFIANPIFHFRVALPTFKCFSPPKWSIWSIVIQCHVTNNAQFDGTLKSPITFGASKMFRRHCNLHGDNKFIYRIKFCFMFVWLLDRFWKLMVDLGRFGVIVDYSKV